MADVSLDATVSTSTARGMRSVVFTTPAIGYCFYIDSDGVFGYSKTTDGGASWGAQVNVDGAAATTVVAFDVWFDKWTPGITGTLVHTWWFDSTNNIVRWRTLDTNGDTLGTVRTVFTGASAVAGRGAFVSGTKTRSGYLYCAYDLDAGAERGLHRSTDSGTTWSANLATTFVEATLDTCKLYPASNTGDDNDCWAVYYDASATALTLKLWDSSAVSQVESATIGVAHTDGATDLTGQFGYDAMVRHSDGHLILVSQSGRDVAAGTDQVFDITSTASIATKTAIVSSGDDHYYPQIFIDQNSDAIYVAYNGKRDGSETMDTTTKVYYTKSTDGGTTWSAGDTAYMEGAAGVVLQVWTDVSGPRFYCVWRVAGTLVSNKVNSVVIPLVASKAEAITVAESVTPALGDVRLAVSKSETITVTENVKAVVTPLAVHAADTITVTEALRVGRNLGTRRSDAITVTESRRVGRNLGLVKSETITVTESRRVGRNLGLVKSETITVTEARTAQLAIPLPGGTVSVSDAVTVLDVAHVVVRPFVARPRETITVTEFVKAVVRPLAVHATDAITVSESWRVLLRPLLTRRADSVTVGELVRAVLTPMRLARADTITVTEFVKAVVRPLTVHAADAVTASEFMKALVKPLAVHAAETLTVAEYVKPVIPVVYGRAVETVTVGELLRASLTPLVARPVDVVTVTEFMQPVMGIVPQPELISVEDSVVAALTAIVHFVTVEIRAEGSQVRLQGSLSGRVGSGTLRRVPSLAGGTIRRLNSLATRASETVAVQDHVTVAHGLAAHSMEAVAVQDHVTVALV